MKKALILSGDYPGYGGEATTAYNLLSLLMRHGYDCQLLYINDHTLPIDPDNTGRSHRLYVSSQTMLHKLVGMFKAKPAATTHSTVEHITSATFINAVRVALGLMRFLLSHQFSPQVVIISNPKFYRAVKMLFASKKVVVIVGGCPVMSKLAKQSVDAVAVLNSSAPVQHNVHGFQFGEAKVLFNSELTQSLYQKLGLYTGPSLVQYFNITPAQQSTVQAKLYDVAFIASDLSRIIKNPVLAGEIYTRLSSSKKIAIGKNNAQFAGIPNTQVHDLVPQSAILATLSQTRLLIITSYFDSSPGILSEAILNGCNVLVSKNIGWHHMLDERCVVQNYNDVDEWVSKASDLIAHPVANSLFEQVIDNAAQDIVACIG